MTAPGSFSAGDVLTAADMNDLTGGLLASAETTSDFTFGTSGLSSLDITFTIPTARYIYLVGVVPLIDNPSTTMQIGSYISTSTTHLSEVYQMTFSAISTTINQTNQHVLRAFTLAAGTYTFYLWHYAVSGTARLNNASGLRRTGLYAFDMGDGT